MLEKIAAVNVPAFDPDRAIRTPGCGTLHVTTHGPYVTLKSSGGEIELEPEELLPLVAALISSHDHIAAVLDGDLAHD